MTRNGAATPGRAGGQTLLELVVVVAVAGALASQALPAFERLILDSRRTATVNELVAALLLARTEALTRRQPVIACGVRDANANGQLEPAERTCAGRDWSQGWLVGAWQDADGDNAVDAGELVVLREHVADPGNQLRVTANSFTPTPPIAPAGTTVLKPFGQRSGNGTVTVCDRRGSAHARGVVLSGNGRTRVASRTAAGGPLICP